MKPHLLALSSAISIVQTDTPVLEAALTTLRELCKRRNRARHITALRHPAADLPPYMRQPLQQRSSASRGNLLSRHYDRFL